MNLRGNHIESIIFYTKRVIMSRPFLFCFYFIPPIFQAHSVYSSGKRPCRTALCTKVALLFCVLCRYFWHFGVFVPAFLVKNAFKNRFCDLILNFLLNLNKNSIFFDFKKVFSYFWAYIIIALNLFIHFVGRCYT